MEKEALNILKVLMPEGVEEKAMLEIPIPSSPQQENSDVVPSRKLIKDGTLSFETDNVAKTKTEVEKVCKAYNAYVSNENQNNYGERLEYHQEIRVPANSFDQLMQKIEALGTRVENKNIRTRDVTEEFIDVEARLKTKLQLEARYRDLLKQAKTVSEILSIETQIGTVRSEIESMQGRLNYLKNQVALSTLNVTYYQRIGTDFGFASKFIQSVRAGWDNLLSFMIGLVSIWPFLIITSGLIWLFLKWKRKRKPVSVQ